MFKVEMKISNDSRKIMSNLREIPVKLSLGVKRECKNSADRMRNDVLLSMKHTQKTGRIYKKGKTVFHRASSPGYPPAMDEGTLAESIIVDVTREGIEVGSEKNIAGYGSYLETGTKKMKPRPFLEPAMKREVSIFEKNIDKVIRNEIE